MHIIRRLLRRTVYVSSTVLVAVCAINGYIIRRTHASIIQSPAQIPASATLPTIGIVLGAGVRYDIPTNAFARRLDTSIALYEQGFISRILVSGSSELGYNELLPAQKYLIQRNIPRADIVLDFGGHDTYSTIYRAKNTFEITNAYIISQQYHLYRALFFARHLDIDAYGMVAPQRIEIGIGRHHIREFFANIKGFFHIVFDHSAADIDIFIPPEYIP